MLTSNLLLVAQLEVADIENIDLVVLFGFNSDSFKSHELMVLLEGRLLSGCLHS